MDINSKNEVNAYKKKLREAVDGEIETGVYIPTDTKYVVKNERNQALQDVLTLIDEV